MSRPRLFVCNGVSLPQSDPLRAGRHVVPLATRGRKTNVNLKIENVTDAFSRQVNDRLQDLLEIATFVYVADSATERSGKWQADESQEPWERDLRFVIPVRDLDFWTKTTVSDLLSETLSFLSNDEYNFDFRPMPSRIAQQEYFDSIDDHNWPLNDVDRVILFSGGLDSLAGAVQTAGEGKNLLLVSHRPVTTQGSRQRELFTQLKAAFPQVKMVHIPVEINKNQNLKGDYFQRTRSFLFSALGAVVASTVGAGGIRFFENGVVSLNLPVAGETIGARASRTTHPISLHLFSKLFELVLGRQVAVDNPFIHLTKGEVLDKIVQCGRQHLISYTCSCAHQGYGQTRLSLHCGTCSQCIDRRFAILSRKLNEFDPERDYRTDVFCGQRGEGYQQNMAVNYVAHADALHQMTPDQIAAAYNMELSRAVRHAQRRDDEAQCLIDMYKRHAKSVCDVLEEQIKREAKQFVNGGLPVTSLLRLVTSGEHHRPSWIKFADRIGKVLQAGLPTACRKQKPKTEPDLQPICDGLLRGADEALQREYPYMQWAWGMTKPDWSSEPHRLWVELKYVRRTASAASIGEAIAADITRYGDNGQRVLFLVYDPDHLIPDDAQFKGQINREGVHTIIIR
ncbi:MAG: 7-cyano-7-deazaguanine synthase [Planctomycetia bacterium]|nr:7-cyano-7-deazaguanine synthase [Planctomycetia bacterium]